MAHGESRQDHPASEDHEPAHHKRESRVSQPTSLFPWDYISLDVGRARCFLRMTNQLPNVCCLWVGTPPNQSLLFPGRTDRVSLVSLVPDPPSVPFWLLWYMCLPPPGPTSNLVMEGAAFLSNYLASMLHTQCKNHPLPPSWLVGETPQRSETDCFTVTGPQLELRPPDPWCSVTTHCFFFKNSSPVSLRSVVRA